MWRGGDGAGMGRGATKRDCKQRTLSRLPGSLDYEIPGARLGISRTNPEEADEKERGR